MTAEKSRMEILERMRDRVTARDEAGNFTDGDALLEALITAASLGLPMPQWLAGRVAQAVSSYRNYEVKTLDEAFGVQRPKGKRLDAEQSERQNALYVVAETLRLHAEGEPISANLFEMAGASCGIGKTTAEAWFYKHKNARTDIYLVALQMAGVKE